MNNLSREEIVWLYTRGNRNHNDVKQDREGKYVMMYPNKKVYIPRGEYLNNLIKAIYANAKISSRRFFKKDR